MCLQEVLTNVYKEIHGKPMHALLMCCSLFFPEIFPKVNMGIWGQDAILCDLSTTQNIG